MTRIRILFVDDEPSILAGLRRLLHGQRGEWDMVFAPGGAAALTELEGGPFDVVVTDMRMPGIDGTEVLAHVRRLHPGAARIVLSGHTEAASAVRSVPFAHQFLSKPCDPGMLKETVRRACSLQARLQGDGLRRVLGAVDALPSPPRVVLDLNAVLARADAGIDDVVAVITQDPAMSAKLLQLVNSAFFGLPRRATGLREAVAYLGVDAVRNVASAVEAFRAFDDSPHLPAGTGAALHAHAMVVAGIAGDLVDAPQRHDTFTAALLHDIGLLALAARMPDALGVALEQARAGGRPLPEVEIEVIGATHADIGAYLLSLWGLPLPIVESVAHHHEAPEFGGRHLDALHATYIAEALAAESGGHDGLWEAPRQPLEVAYLDAIGAADRVAGWQMSQGDDRDQGVVPL